MRLFRSRGSTSTSAHHASPASTLSEDASAEIERHAVNATSRGRTSAVLDLMSADLHAADSGPGRRRTCVLTVKPHDGATWIVHQAERLCQESFPRTEVVVIGRTREDKRHEITRVIGARQFAKIAQEQRISTQFRTLRWPWLVGAALVVAGTAVLATILSAQTRGPLSPVLLLAAGGLALAMLAVQPAKDLLMPGRFKKALDALYDTIEAMPRTDDPRWDAFISALAGRACRPRHDRAIIADFEELDDLSQRVIFRLALPEEKDDAPPAHHTDFLLVVETDPPGALAHRFTALRWNPRLEHVSMWRQLPLTHEERRRAAFGRPGRESYETIGAILSNREGYEPKIAKIVEGVRGSATRQRPSRFDCVDLAHLLAVPASSYGEVIWNIEELKQSLTNAPDELGPLVQALFPGFLPDEFDLVREELEDEFESVLEPSSRRGETVSLSREAAEVLVENGGTWQLADQKNVHLFWAFVTHKRAVETPGSPYWVHKAAMHIRYSRRPATEPKARQILGIWLADVLADTLARSVTGLLTDNLSFLARKLADLVEEDPGIARRRAAVELLGLISEVTQPKPAADRATKLAAAVTSAKRSTDRAGLRDLATQLQGGKQKVPRDAPEPSDVSAALAALKVSEAAWLAVELFGSSRTAVVPQRCRLLSWVGSAFAHVRAFSEEEPAEARAGTGSPALADSWALLTDINLVWTTGLFVKVARSGQAAQEVVLARLRAVLTRAARADTGDDLSNLLVLELKLTLAASALMAAAGTEGHVSVQFQVLATTAAASADVHVSPTDHGEAAAGIRDALDFVALSWDRFGFARLNAFTRIRLSEFQAAVLSSDTSQVERVTTALVAELASDADLALLIDLSTATHLRSGGELEAQLAMRAARNARELGAGEHLTATLDLIAVLDNGPYGMPVCDLLADLFSRPDASPRELLSSYSDTSLGHGVNSLLNGALTCDTSNHHDSLMQTAREQAAGMENAEARDQLEILLDLQELEGAQTWHKPIDVPAVLAKWSTRPRDAKYAFLLYRLMAEQSGREQVTEEAVRLLEELAAEDIDRDHLLLALDVLQAAPEHAAKAFWVVAHSMEQYDTTLPIETNVAVYEQLLRVRPYATGLQTRLDQWKQAQLAHDELTLLPTLASDKKPYLLFSYYCRLLQPYGLAFDDSGVDTDARRAALPAEWQAAGRPHIAPLSHRDGRLAISSRYLLIGDAIFQPAADEAGEAEKNDKVRKDFDDSATSALRGLFDMIPELELVPKPIRDTLRKHYDLYVAPLTN